MRRALAAVVLLSAFLFAVGTGSARADHNDLTLERIVGAPATPGGYNDPTDPARQSMYKSLMSELGVVMAPHLLSPADTLGFSGFQLDFNARFTQITDTADYWQRGVENVSGSWLSTISVMARKGVWFPLPSLEVGAGATKLNASNLYALEAYAKLGIHEGYHDLPIPSIAFRGAVSRPVGSSQVDLTVVSVDATLSKSFGIGGTLKLDPYLGANLLLTFVRGQVIDATPNVDAYRQGPTSTDLNANTTFADPDTILRWRLFAGFRLVYWIVAFTGEFVYTLCNDTGASCGHVDAMAVTDRSLGQSQINFSASLVF